MKDEGWFVDQNDPKRLVYWDGEKWLKQFAYLESHSRLQETNHHVIDDSFADTGILEPIFLNGVEFYKARVDEVKEEIKNAVKNDSAIVSHKKIVVSGSSSQAKKVVNNFKKLAIRSYTKEAEFITRFLKDSNKFESSLEKLEKMKKSIDSLIETMGMSIHDDFHKLHVVLLRLRKDEAIKKEEAEEIAREERERIKEERIAQQEIKKKRDLLIKEAAQRKAALEMAMKNSSKESSEQDLEKIRVLQSECEEIEQEMQKEEQREANLQAGYVYVVSNIGSFGEGVVKIGMTRRVDPMDRVKELSDASVPFSFDAHLIHYSDKARRIESELHRIFSDFRINLVNNRKEFFNISLDDVQQEIQKLDGTVTSFNRVAEATEHKESILLRKRMELKNTRS